MLDFSEVRDIVTEVVAAEGLVLFDLECGGDILKVYLTRKIEGGNKDGVGIGECARVSSRISNDLRLEEFLTEYALEVSSPGINRKLRSLEHFKGAIGERVKVVVIGPPDRTVKGVVMAVEGSAIQIREEGAESAEVNALTIPFEKIRRAAVDFLF